LFHLDAPEKSSEDWDRKCSEMDQAGLPQEGPKKVSFREMISIDDSPMPVYYGALLGQKKEIARHGIEPPYFTQYRELKERFGSEEEFKKAYPGTTIAQKAYEIASNFFPRYKYQGLGRELDLLIFGVPISLDLDYAAKHARAVESMGGIVLAVEVDKPHSRIESIRSEGDATLLLMQGVIGIEGKLLGVYYSEGAVKYKHEVEEIFKRFKTDISPLAEVSPRLVGD